MLTLLTSCGLLAALCPPSTRRTLLCMRACGSTAQQAHIDTCAHMRPRALPPPGPPAVLVAYTSKTGFPIMTLFGLMSLPGFFTKQVSVWW